MSDAETPGSRPSEVPPPPPAAPPFGAAPPPATPPPSWSPQTATQAVPGAAGFIYADVPNRLIAFIIDAILLVLIYIVVAIPLSIIGFSAGFSATSFDIVSQLIFGAIYLAISLGYFIWTWTSRRATVGMSLLGMQVGNAFDGRTLTTDQAVRRALALWGPGILSSIFGNSPGIGALLGLVGFVWTIYLLYSTATSPTKQGFHDKFANTVVVKAMRVA
jgi:uncharacterized RDD family membrane protein YckC